jgi:hypothetical protein
MWAYRNTSGNRSVASVSNRKVPYIRSSSAEHCVLLAPRAMPAAYARRSPGSSAAAAIATARPMFISTRPRSSLIAPQVPGAPPQASLRPARSNDPTAAAPPRSALRPERELNSP